MPQTRKTRYIGGELPVRRFPFREDVRYKCLKGHRVYDKGLGKTLLMTSREVRFTTEHALKPGQEVEVTVNWPVLLGKRCLMKLVIRGQVVSSEAESTVVRIRRYEFRTRAAKPMLAVPLVLAAG